MVLAGTDDVCQSFALAAKRVPGGRYLGLATLRGAALPSATRRSCCCQPWSHFQPEPRAAVMAATMKVVSWVSSRLAPGTIWATKPANQPAARTKTGGDRATNRPNQDASVSGAGAIAFSTGSVTGDHLSFRCNQG